MMRMAVTTHNVLKRLHSWGEFRPYNFFLLPILANCGYPASVDPKHFTLVAPFESDQRKWIDSVCINIGDPDEDKKKYRLITDFRSPEYAKRAGIDTFENLFYRYFHHPEAKSLGPDAKPCGRFTHGLLQRTHVIAGEHRRIGKESDRRWEEGDDFESTTYESIEYTRNGEVAKSDSMERASERLIRKIKNIGVRPLVQFGCGRRILEKICRRELVRLSTLHEYERIIQECKSG